MPSWAATPSGCSASKSPAPLRTRAPYIRSAGAPCVRSAGWFSSPRLYPVRLAVTRDDGVHVRARERPDCGLNAIARDVVERDGDRDSAFERQSNGLIRHEPRPGWRVDLHIALCRRGAINRDDDDAAGLEAVGHCPHEHG